VIELRNMPEARKITDFASSYPIALQCDQFDNEFEFVCETRHNGSGASSARQLTRRAPVPDCA
jgi:hypothetical protein